MSPSFLVAAILAIGWNLTLAAAVLLTDAEPTREAASESESRVMQWSQETVRAEVGRPAFDARAAVEEDGAGDPPAQAPPRVRTSQEVAVDVRYADASVTVLTEEGMQLRHCSVCMN
jgi:hypothetical protein